MTHRHYLPKRPYFFTRFYVTTSRKTVLLATDVISLNVLYRALFLADKKWHRDTTCRNVRNFIPDFTLPHPGKPYYWQQMLFPLMFYSVLYSWLIKSGTDTLLAETSVFFTRFYVTTYRKTVLLATNVISLNILYRAVFLTDKKWHRDITCRNVRIFYQILRYHVPENRTIGNKCYFP